jgi:hypothetical protein
MKRRANGPTSWTRTSIESMTGDLAAWLLEQIAEDESRVRLFGRPLGHELMGGWDLRRVLAECDAKRLTVEQYLAAQVDETGDRMHQAMQRAERSALLEVLRRWGAVYAKGGRPGYREEWRP